MFLRVLFHSGANADMIDTWFLVGVATRMAIGMGLHTSSTYENIPVDVSEYRKRIFWSLYMMDRVVSMALGRPFAMRDEDIDVEVSFSSCPRTKDETNRPADFRRR